MAKIIFDSVEELVNFYETFSLNINVLSKPAVITKPVTEKVATEKVATENEDVSVATATTKTKGKGKTKVEPVAITDVVEEAVVNEEVTNEADVAKPIVASDVTLMGLSVDISQAKLITAAIPYLKHFGYTTPHAVTNSEHHDIICSYWQRLLAKEDSTALWTDFTSKYKV